MKLNLDSSKGCYSSHVGLNMYEVIYRFRQAYISGARIFFPTRLFNKTKAPTMDKVHVNINGFPFATSLCLCRGLIIR